MNPHLDNKLIRIRQKMKYGALLTNNKLYEWGLAKEKNCSFCGKIPEDIDHLLSGCEILEPIWEKARETTQQKWKVSQNLLDKKIGIKIERQRRKKDRKIVPEDNVAIMGNQTQGRKSREKKRRSEKNRRKNNVLRRDNEFRYW